MAYKFSSLFNTTQGLFPKHPKLWKKKKDTLFTNNHFEYL